MSKGTLQIKVTTADGRIPVSDANVRVRDAMGGVVYTLTTDVSGLTTVVSLFAPSKELSLSPHSSHLSYSSYEIMVTHSGYVPQFVRGVRVFDGVGGLLPVDLSPRTAQTDLGNSVNVVDIPPPSAQEPMNFPPSGAVWGGF